MPPPPVHEPLPVQVVEALAERGGLARVVGESPGHAGTGAATGTVSLLDVEVSSGDAVETLTIVLKRLRPVTSGRHAAHAADPRHWAYWRRELEAYPSGLLAETSALRSPRCLAVACDDLYLEHVAGDRPSVDRAARALASWRRARDLSLDRPWIAEDQLLARLAVTELDWSEVDADPRMPELWGHRSDLIDRMCDLPRVLSHGDFSIGNLIDTGGEIVAFDWATLGWEPTGFDLGHLALSCGVDPTHAFLDASPTDTDSTAVLAGYAITVALVGASRTHWMLSRGIEPPAWYADMVWECGSIARSTR